jgi:3'(2'), 5'-bisphosphate nucleotidase
MKGTWLSDEDIEFVSDLAKRAGSLADQMREGVGVRSKSNPQDLVTDADVKVSELIVRELGLRFPQDLVVSEESSNPCGTSGSSRLWFVDPIDGTKNYVNVDGQWSSMIGFTVDGAAAYGWLFQPSTDTLFHGGPAHGAFRQVGSGKPAKIAARESLTQRKPVRLMFGYGEMRKHPWLVESQDLCFVRSESLGLKAVKILDDEADLFISLTGRVKLWDTAAPGALALGAGLEVGTVAGTPLDYSAGEPDSPRTMHGTSVIIGCPGSLEWARRQFENRLGTAIQ